MRQTADDQFPWKYIYPIASLDWSGGHWFANDADPFELVREFKIVHWPTGTLLVRGSTGCLTFRTGELEFHAVVERSEMLPDDVRPVPCPMCDGRYTFGESWLRDDACVACGRVGWMPATAARAAMLTLGGINARYPEYAAWHDHIVRVLEAARNG